MPEYFPNESIPGTSYVYDKGILPLVNKLDERVKDLRNHGKLTPDVLKHIQKYFRIKNIHHSNAIEGNRLEYRETRMVVEEGLTITGKPLKDTLEAKNLSHALDYFEILATQKDKPIRMHDIRQIHAAILKGIDDVNGGVFRKSEVEITGSEFKPPTYIQVPNLMEQFCDWLEQVTSQTSQTFQTNINPLILACATHTWFVYIHPFTDGNGRTARILMNLVLMRKDYPISVITQNDKSRYYDALETSHCSDLTPFISLITDTVEESLDEYESAVRENRTDVEWARSLMSQVEQIRESKVKVQYEVWRSAMELLRGYVKQIVDTLNEYSPQETAIVFTGYDVIDFEKFLNAQQGVIIKRSWFFRIDFVTGNDFSRYMFFFGLPSMFMRNEVHESVSVFISREESPFNYEKLDHIHNSQIPLLKEIGYSENKESYICRYGKNSIESKKVELFVKEFITEAVEIHLKKKS
jgi:Fic family protein